jgi:antitoxin component YwqK of YwqJK toxin-antitoxin module
LFKLDKRTGLGTAFDENGLIFYKGKWINDIRQGKGVSYMESGSKEYEGYWVKDKVSPFQ